MKKRFFVWQKLWESKRNSFKCRMSYREDNNRRAAIARAVYTHPTILLGDQLTGNLDSRTSASVMELLKKISRQYQQTMLVVTHDKKVAAMAIGSSA